MAMAISTCSDCSFPLINSSIKSYKFTLFSSCKNLPFFILPTSNLSLFHVNSSGYPSPILEDSSTNLPNPMIESDQQFSPNNFDSFLYGLLQDPQTQHLAYEYYNKAKENREFRPEKPTLKLLISCISARKFKVLNSLLQVLKTDGDIAVLAFDSAMRGYNKLHMYSSTITLYETMKSAEIVPNSSCYCQIMEAYNKIGDTEKVVSLFHEFEGRKLDATPFFTSIYRLVCDSLGKCGRAFEALKVFRDMTRKGSMEKTLDIVVSMKKAKLKVSDCILCAIVNGFCKKRGYWAAIKVYEQLISQGCSPGQVTYASIINAYCRIGLYSKAEMVFSEMQEKGFDKCVVAYSSIVAMYGKTGRIRDAMRLVAKMKAKGCEPNVWIYNSLMDTHGRAKNLRQVEKLWKEMKRRKVAADKVSYTSVISAYNKAREFEKCVNFYNEYRMNGGVIDRAMGGIMVGVFSKLSRIEELVKLLRDMKSEGTRLDERLYHSALNALRDAGLHMQVQWLQQNFEGT
ncbi:hypothetical protein Patl1_15679 [Pistacia atlantica]|uniref:Uncharacterized protein n=1 Tax=Pistacia atlantica TaxID=434234 RepID=A0ACC1BA47_9ROSI|nr:hypothetical protein Patl1_15679 [Pistacia atlantica]